jgi:hypothetical protein
MEIFLMLLGHPAAISGLLFLVVVTLWSIAGSISTLSESTQEAEIKLGYKAENQVDEIAQSLFDINIELSKLNDI